jgi:hypothetical protein
LSGSFASTGNGLAGSTGPAELMPPPGSRETSAESLIIT